MSGTSFAMKLGAGFSRHSVRVAGQHAADEHSTSLNRQRTSASVSASRPDSARLGAPKNTGMSRAGQHAAIEQHTNVIHSAAMTRDSKDRHTWCKIPSHAVEEARRRAALEK